MNGAIGALVALRLGRSRPRTFSIAANDYGVELLTTGDIDVPHELSRVALHERQRGRHSFASVNHSELAKTQFREIARVAGLVVQTYPGTKKTGRQLGASSSLIFDVLSEFDPANLLIAQSRREVLEQAVQAQPPGAYAGTAAQGAPCCA